MASAQVLAPTWAVADDESLNLMLSLLLEDVREINASSKGKQVEGDLSDVELALQRYSHELSHASAFAADRRITKSVRFAVQPDIEILLQTEREERMVRNDREISASLEQGSQTPEQHDDASAELTDEDMEMWQKMSALFIYGVDDQDDADGVSDVETLGTEADQQPESSAWAAARLPEVERRQCDACAETKRLTDLARAPCRHEYCRDCLARLFWDATRDETFFPPRCCR
ncbi:hypothetical protein F5Y15DRAFT_147566 [Xylariaceae sp. FL0016]|nr:hypothetical protein F5Y15DRAFT_147566 [Xylariaceae sp. FL0016]